MNRLVIAPPFGNYLRFAGATSTLGTYTLHRRAGFLRRWWRVLCTVRYSRRTQSWVNRLGLPSPGIEALLGESCWNSILSIHGFGRDEWETLVAFCEHRYFDPLALEFNLSCPNVQRHPSLLREVEPAIARALALPLAVVAKLPPVRWLDLGRPLHRMGVRHFHLCNTIPTPGGGMSGKPLMQYSLWAVEDFRQAFGDDVALTGGGGVTSLDDVRAYLQAGADHVSVGSMLFNPLNWRKVPRMVRYADDWFAGTGSQAKGAL